MLLYLDVRRKDSAFALAGPEVYRFDMPRDNFRAAQLVFVVKESDIDVSVLTPTSTIPTDIGF